MTAVAPRGTGWVRLLDGPRAGARITVPSARNTVVMPEYDPRDDVTEYVVHRGLEDWFDGDTPASVQPLCRLASRLPYRFAEQLAATAAQAVLGLLDHPNLTRAPGCRVQVTIVEGEPKVHEDEWGPSAAGHVTAETFGWGARL